MTTITKDQPITIVNNRKKPASRLLYNLVTKHKAPYGECSKCHRPYTHRNWCPSCQKLIFCSEFTKWTSGNKLIDDLIKETQLNAQDKTEYIEWIPYKQLTDVNYLTTGSFAKIYTAIWKGGLRQLWDEKTQQFVRHGDRKVVLKEVLMEPTKGSDIKSYIEQVSWGF